MLLNGLGEKKYFDLPKLTEKSVVMNTVIENVLKSVDAQKDPLV